MANINSKRLSVLIAVLLSIPSLVWLFTKLKEMYRLSQFSLVNAKDKDAVFNATMNCIKNKSEAWDGLLAGAKQAFGTDSYFVGDLLMTCGGWPLSIYGSKSDFALNFISEYWPMIIAYFAGTALFVLAASYGLVVVCPRIFRWVISWLTAPEKLN